MTWDRAGLDELKSIKQEIYREMENKTVWFKLSQSERIARHNMIKAIEQIEVEQAEAAQ